MKNMLCNSGWGTHRDLAISTVRSLAFMSIILCHIFQYFGIELAWWFNVGVQIFLCMSGFLYGKKKIEGVLSFYKKTAYKDSGSILFGDSFYDRSRSLLCSKSVVYSENY